MKFVLPLGHKYNHGPGFHYSLTANMFPCEDDEVETMIELIKNSESYKGYDIIVLDGYIAHSGLKKGRPNYFGIQESLIQQQEEISKKRKIEID